MIPARVSIPVSLTGGSGRGIAVSSGCASMLSCSSGDMPDRSPSQSSRSSAGCSGAGSGTSSQSKLGAGACGCAESSRNGGFSCWKSSNVKASSSRLSMSVCVGAEARLACETMLSSSLSQVCVPGSSGCASDSGVGSAPVARTARGRRIPDCGPCGRLTMLRCRIRSRSGSSSSTAAGCGGVGAGGGAAGVRIAASQSSSASAGCGGVGLRADISRRSASQAGAAASGGDSGAGGGGGTARISPVMTLAVFLVSDWKNASISVPI